MPLDANSKARAVGTGIENKQFVPTAQNVQRKMFIIGQYDPTITSVVDYEPVLVTSAEQVGALTGFGFPLHRSAIKAERGSGGIEMWISPLPPAGGAAQSTGSIDFATSAPTENGTLPLYISGDRVPVGISKTDTPDDICQNTVDAINADRNLPVTAAVNGVTTSQADLTSKAAWALGDVISITFAWGFQEELPDGVVAAVTDMSGGSGQPVLDMEAAMGLGDNQNQRFWTELNIPWVDDTEHDAVSEYNGEGNTLTGDFDKLVARPFRCPFGTPPGVDLAGIIGYADTRKLDRTNNPIWVPGSPNHPAEIGACAMGVMAKISNNIAHQNYSEQLLPGIIAGAHPQETDVYDNRDLAVKNGISPTIGVNGNVFLQNVQSFYRPDAVPATSNGWASSRNMAISQNILFNHKVNFSQEKWIGNSIVADVTKVTNAIDRQKVKDRDAVMDDLLALADAYESKGWIFSAAWTKAKLLAEPWRVAIRPDGLGWNTFFPVQYSGEQQIMDNLIEFDVAISTQL